MWGTIRIVSANKRATLYNDKLPDDLQGVQHYHSLVSDTRTMETWSGCQSQLQEYLVHIGKTQEDFTEPVAKQTLLRGRETVKEISGLQEWSM